MSLFAILCSNSEQRRRIEALLLSTKFPIAKDGQDGVTHVLVADKTLPFESNYPDAEIFFIDATELDGLPAKLRKLMQQPAAAEIQELIGTSPQIETVRRTIAMVAESDATVLITGETGCGKECAARMVHRLSHRNAMPLVALNCAAIPDTMLEGELFGYEKGAFTGAIRAYPGKIKLADRGTLALDEIGDLSPMGQAKILRAIETHEFYRLGAVKPERFNARIVAMTNVDLAGACANNTFRKDLYYRLAVAQVHLPPLRERPEDVLPLAHYFLRNTSHEIAADAADALQSYSWPGNVRELSNVMVLAGLGSSGGIIRASVLPPQFHIAVYAVGVPRSVSERERLLEALKLSGGNKSVAAKSLNWSRMTLYRKLETYHIAISPHGVTQHVTV